MARGASRHERSVGDQTSLRGTAARHRTDKYGLIRHWYYLTLKIGGDHARPSYLVAYQPRSHPVKAHATPQRKNSRKIRHQKMPGSLNPGFRLGCRCRSIEYKKLYRTWWGRAVYSRTVCRRDHCHSRSPSSIALPGAFAGVTGKTRTEVVSGEMRASRSTSQCHIYHVLALFLFAYRSLHSQR